MKNDVKTLEITNFTGRLTRVLNGDLNSGFAKFDSSWGYDPFSKPQNLTWFEAPTDLDPSDASIAMTMVCAKPRVEGGNQVYIYAIGTDYSGGAAKLFKIQPNSIGNPNLDSTSVLATLANNDFLFGGSMEFFGSTQKIYFTGETRLTSIGFDGSGEANLGGAFTTSSYHPLVKFLGNLYAADKNNLRALNSSGAETNSSVLSPALPSDTFIRDMGVTPDGDYIAMASSEIPPEQQDYGYDRVSASTGTGYIFNWNGVDAGITNYRSFPSHAVTAFKTYMNNQYLFSNDSFGMSIDNGSKKVRTLGNNRSAIPNTVVSDGNFISWMTTEFANSTLFGSMYYYGSLDEESPSGLWRMFRQASSQVGGFEYTMPFQILANNKFSTLNSTASSVTAYGYGKHYFSTYDYKTGSIKYKLYRFLVTPTGTGTPTLGVYETQTQLFSKRITVKQIRVYTEPTATSNGFQLDLIGSDGNIVTNGTFTYTFAGGTDVTLLQGAQERINFNPTTKDLYALGIRITNTGTTNMSIKKVEVDIEQSGK